jgi:glycosyltransferase involved in cell wall biosynthesis
MISVVIPAYNEEQAIGTCLEALAKQTTTIPFDVIVVDNNSTDRTVEITKSFQDRLSLRVINEPMQGRGAARKRGFAEATGEILFSTDADTQVPPTWIDSLIAAIQSNPKNVAAVTSAVIHDFSAVKNALYNAICWIAVRHSETLYGFSFAVKREIYHASGGFDAESDAEEDVELGYKVRKLGRIKFVNLPVPTSGRRFKHGLIRGYLLYLTAYVKKFFLGKKRIPLDNPR